MRIAIVKLSALGDIVHAMVALQFIKAQLPDIEIDWIVEERFSQILQYNPDISHIHSVNIKGIKKDKLSIFKELKKLRRYAKNQYDLVIDAQGLVKSAVASKLLGKKVAGFDKNSIRESVAAKFYDFKVACAYDENTIDRNATVLSKPLGFSISSEQIYNKRPFLFIDKANHQLDDYFLSERKNVMLVIGSTWESRNYPPEKFVAVASEIQENCLVLWGSAQEKANADWMAKQCDNIKVLPQMDLNGLKSAVLRTDLLIGNDTGPTHMAWALNRPSITLFGPTPISRVYQTEINIVIKSPSVVNPYKLNKLDFSIKDISEHDIIEQAKYLLSKQ